MNSTTYLPSTAYLVSTLAELLEPGARKKEIGRVRRVCHRRTPLNKGRV